MSYVSLINQSQFTGTVNATELNLSGTVDFTEATPILGLVDDVTVEMITNPVSLLVKNIMQVKDAGITDVKIVSMNSNKLTGSMSISGSTIYFTLDLDMGGKNITNVNNITASGLISSRNILPDADNVYTIGTALLRYLRLYVTNITLNGTDLDTRLTTDESNITTLQNKTQYQTASSNITTFTGTIAVPAITLNGTDINTRLTTDESNITTLQNKTQYQTASGSVTTFTGTLSVPTINNSTGVAVQYNGSTKLTTDTYGVSLNGNIFTSGLFTPAATIVNPTTITLPYSTWSANSVVGVDGFTYTISASSSGIGRFPYQAIYTSSIGSGWQALSNDYNAGTGVYGGAFTTSVNVNGTPTSYGGEWIQIDFGRIVLVTSSTGNYTATIGSIVVAGSIDASTWYIVSTVGVPWNTSAYFRSCFRYFRWIILTTANGIGRPFLDGMQVVCSSTATFNSNTIVTPAITLNGTDINTRLTTDETNISTLQTKTQYQSASGSVTTFTGGLTSTGNLSCGTNAVTAGSISAAAALTVNGVGVNVQYSGSTKLATNNTGVAVTGTMSISGSASCVGLTTTGAIAAGTNSLTCGSLSCTSMTSSGSMSCGTNSITAGSIIATAALTVNGVGVNVQYNGSTKIATNNTGVAVTGTMSISGSASCVGLTSTGAIAAGTNSLTCGAVSCAAVTASGLITGSAAASVSGQINSDVNGDSLTVKLASSSNGCRLRWDTTSATNGAWEWNHRVNGYYQLTQGAAGTSGGGAGTLIIACDGTTATKKVGILTAPDQSLTVSGNASKTAAGAWVAISDKRIKHSIRPWKRGLNEIMQLRPVMYKFKPETGHIKEILDKDHLGYIAQELKIPFPEAVEIKPRRINPNDETSELIEDCHSVDITPVCFASAVAIQELAERVRILEKKINKLLSKNSNS